MTIADLKIGQPVMRTGIDNLFGEVPKGTKGKISHVGALGFEVEWEENYGYRHYNADRIYYITTCINTKEQEIIQHLIKGLEEIVALKEIKQYKDPITQLFGDALTVEGKEISKDGWVDFPKSTIRAFQKASKMAQDTLDSIP